MDLEEGGGGKTKIPSKQMSAEKKGLVNDT
jgi:hypothetical protein